MTVTHSRMNYGERFDQWKKARTGQVSVMIGPRSALFYSICKPWGDTIIDEEHESSYKSDTTPKYHAERNSGKISTSNRSSCYLWLC